MKSTFYIFIFLFVSIGALGQQKKIDSLLVEYSKTNIDSNKCEIIKKLLGLYYYVDMKKAIIYSDSLLIISKRVGPKIEAWAYRTKGVILFNQRKLDAAKKMFDTSLVIAKKINDEPLEATLYGSLAVYYDRMENLVMSGKYYKKAIQLNKKNGRERLNLDSYMNMGIRNAQNDNYKESMVYLNKALQISESYKNFNASARIHSQIGKNYIELNQPEKAKVHLNKAFSLAKKLNNNRGLYSYYRRMGSLYELQNNHQQTLVCYDSALVYAHKIMSPERIQELHHIIGEEYILLKNYPLAEEHLRKALKICREKKMKTPEATVLRDLGRLEALNGNVENGVALINKGKEKIGDAYVNSPRYFTKTIKAYVDANEYKLAFQELNKHYSINDSVSIDNSSLKIEAMERKYETEKKQKKIIQYQANEEKQTNRIRLLGGSSLALLALLGVFGFYYRRNKKQKDRIVALQKELHHRVDNNLAIVDEFIERTKESIHDKTLLDEMSSLQNRVGSINEVHRMLYQEDDITSINCKKYVQKLGEQVQSVFKKNDVKLELNIPASAKLTTDKSIPLGLIINEFITNSFKYAFDNIRNPKIGITVTEDINELTISLNDNGVGFAKNLGQDTRESYGTDIMSLLARQMNASYQLDGNDGVSLVLQIPKK